jgi:hypothetical protein
VRKILSMVLAVLFVISLGQGIAQAHGRCTALAYRPYLGSSAGRYTINAKGRWECDYNHNSMSIKVQLQGKYSGEWRTIATNEGNKCCNVNFIQRIAPQICTFNSFFTKDYRTRIAYAQSNDGAVHRVENVIGPIFTTYCIY